MRLVKTKTSVVPLPEPRLLRVAEAAQYLGTTIWQMRTLAATGKVPVKRLGQRMLFDRRDLDRFVDGL